MKRNIDRLSTIENDRRKVLVEIRFKHDHFVSRVQECSENGVLSYICIRCLSAELNGELSRLTLICATGDLNLSFHIKIPVQYFVIALLDCLSEPYATLGVRVMVCDCCVESLICSVFDPLWRREVHVTLAQVDAVRGQVGRTE